METIRPELEKFFNETKCKAFELSDLDNFYSKIAKTTVTVFYPMCLIKNERDHFGLFTNELVGDTKEPLEVGIFNKSERGVSLMAIGVIGVYAKELDELPFKEILLKEFMGQRFAYNPRILCNMEEFLNWYKR